MLPAFRNGNKCHLPHLRKDMVLKFVRPCQVAQSYQEGKLASVNFVDPTIQFRRKIFYWPTCMAEDTQSS